MLWIIWLNKGWFVLKFFELKTQNTKFEWRISQTSFAIIKYESYLTFSWQITYLKVKITELLPTNEWD